MPTRITGISGDLSLEAAAFISEMRRAAAETRKNVSAMNRSMETLQRGFARVGNQIRSFVAGYLSLQGIRALAQFGQRVVQTADEIGEASTRIGIAAEDLQRYRFAAAQADVDTAKLDNALRIFAQNLAKGEISAEGKNIAEAFRDYIQQIADAPTQLEKVRIAQEAFGKQWQTAMLLAAQGAQEFQQQADNAFIFSDKALQAASQLDNQFRALRNAIEVGFATGLLEGFSDGLATTQEDLRRLNQVMQDLGRATANTLQAIANFLNAISEAYRDIKSGWDSLPQPLRNAIVSGASFAFNPLGSISSTAQGLMGGAGTAGLPDLGSFEEHVKFWDIGIEKLPTFSEHLAFWNLNVNDSTIALNNNVAAIGAWKTTVEKAAETPEMFGQAWRDNMSSAIGTMQGFTGALAQESKTWFQINKAFAIAQALISTYEGAAKALGQLGAWGPPVAAGIIATGLAYVAMIASQQPGSSGGSRGGRGGSGRGGGGGNGISESVGRSQAVNITLVGSSGFTSEQVLDLMQQINGFVADGVHLNVSQG